MLQENGTIVLGRNIKFFPSVSMVIPCNRKFIFCLSNILSISIYTISNINTIISTIFLAFTYDLFHKQNRQKPTQGISCNSPKLFRKKLSSTAGQMFLSHLNFHLLGMPVGTQGPRYRRLRTRSFCEFTNPELMLSM